MKEPVFTHRVKFKITEAQHAAFRKHCRRCGISMKEELRDFVHYFNIGAYPDL